MRAPSRDLCHHPIPLSNLTINGQMQIRVGLSHVQNVFPGPFEATVVSGAPMDFDVIREMNSASRSTFPVFATSSM